jgi:undecaprenyl phosphate N,N'-diacetylbacillosamine 1-phosphate transferase
MYKTFFKPLFDRVGAFVLMIVFLPLMIVVSLGIYLYLGRDVIFSQLRPGLNGKLFKIYKFRTMSDERDKDGNLLPDEKRLKGVGKLIRKLSLDELPQLFNVLKGEMSFIGPRPLLPEYLNLYNKEQKKRHDVTPGITGWAQINGRNAISWEKKFELDVWYVEHISFVTDMKIVYKTVFKIFGDNDVSSDKHATMEKFDGTN